MTARPPQGRRPGAAPRRSDSAQAEQVAALLEPAVRATGVELEDVELRTVGRRLVLRVLVDSERGVSLDEVAVASQAVSEVLDSSDVLGDAPYTLEVSSPGVDRPLTEPRHWRRSVGRKVAVTLRDGREVTGRVRAVTETEVELELETKGRTSRTTVALVDVARAVVQVEFSRAAEADLGDGSEGDTDGLDEDDDSDESEG